MYQKGFRSYQRWSYLRVLKVELLWVELVAAVDDDDDDDDTEVRWGVGGGWNRDVNKDVLVNVR